MRLRTRLVLVIGAASLIPLAVLGLGATDVSVGRLTQKAADSQARSVDQMASEVDLWLEFQLAQVAEQVDAFQLAKLDDKKLQSFQKLVFQQTKDVHIVAIVSAEGAELVPSLFVSKQDDGHLANKEVVSDARFASFKSSLPTARMMEEQQRWKKDTGKHRSRPIVVGRPYLAPGRKVPVLPVAIPASPNRPMFLVVELALDRIAARFQRASEAGLDVALLDASGHAALERGAGLIDAGHFHIFQPDSACSEVRYTTDDQASVLAACSPIRGTGWMLVVAEPMESITRAGDEIRNRTAYISLFAALLSVLFGILFSGGVAVRITRIRDAALAVAEGNFGRTVALDGASEIRDLSRAFNFMSRRLSANQDRLAHQQHEIAAFNAELRRQLAEQKIELTEAHRLLLQSSRLIAVSEMGAGLAHELNNPLAGILGLVQVLQMKVKGGDAKLSEIEEQARRCTDIVAQLTRYTRGLDSGGGEGERSLVLVQPMLEELVTLLSTPFGNVGVAVHLEEGESLEIFADAEALSGALFQLANSIRAGCRGGGKLAVSFAKKGEFSEIVLALTGVRFDRKSDNWRAAGLGQWLERGVIAQHDGTLVEPKDLSAPTLRWVIQIPAGAVCANS